VLGIWVGSGGEGAKQWMATLAELRNRGVDDVCIVACDGLKGLPEAIGEIWPRATVQLCVVHLVRASLRYASKAHWGPITKALRTVYTAPTVEAAEAAFTEFTDVWGGRYPVRRPCSARAGPQGELRDAVMTHARSASRRRL